MPILRTSYKKITSVQFNWCLRIKILPYTPTTVTIFSTASDSTNKVKKERAILLTLFPTLYSSIVSSWPISYKYKTFSFTLTRLIDSIAIV
jgi:hypothetical protein